MTENPLEKQAHAMAQSILYNAAALGSSVENKGGNAQMAGMTSAGHIERHLKMLESTNPRLAALVAERISELQEGR